MGYIAHKLEVRFQGLEGLYGGYDIIGVRGFYCTVPPCEAECVEYKKADFISAFSLVRLVLAHS